MFYNNEILFLEEGVLESTRSLKKDAHRGSGGGGKGKPGRRGGLVNKYFARIPLPDPVSFDPC